MNFRGKKLRGAYIVTGLAVAFFPTHTNPAFRYTGADPDRLVWNFGWPFATMIYDSIHGIQALPFFWAFVLAELLIVYFLFYSTNLVFSCTYKLLSLFKENSKTKDV
jgi:hypothetical protein